MVRVSKAELQRRVAEVKQMPFEEVKDYTLLTDSDLRVILPPLEIEVAFDRRGTRDPTFYDLCEVVHAR